MDRVVSIQRKGGVATVKCLSGDVLRIPSALFLERRVRVGEPIDPDAYRLFMAQRGYPHALESAMKFLSLRERSEKETAARLRRSCYDEETIRRVLGTLRGHGLLSDSRFAEAWTQSRGRKYGRNRIAQELKSKGIRGDEIGRALQILPEEEEYQQALQQGKKLARRFQGDAKKIFQALIRRGYGFSLARKAAEEAARDDAR